jgi:hypothetical protein
MGHYAKNWPYNTLYEVLCGGMQYEL